MNKLTIPMLAMALLLGACSVGNIKLSDFKVRQNVGQTNAVEVGKSTKSEVRAALGVPRALPFENGYEVWLYRFEPAPGLPTARSRATEYVILFDQAGVVKKVRTREAPAAPEATSK